MSNKKFCDKCNEDITIGSFYHQWWKNDVIDVKCFTYDFCEECNKLVEFVLDEKILNEKSR